MIQHDIIVVKETPVVIPQYSNWVGNTNNSGPITGVIRYPNITSQLELNNWLNTTKFQIGDYVTYCKLPLNAGNLPHAVFRITDRCEDFTKLMAQPYAPYHLKLLFTQVLESETGMGVCEWRDAHGMRLVDTTEMDNVVRPYLDRVRNSRKS